MIKDSRLAEGEVFIANASDKPQKERMRSSDGKTRGSLSRTPQQIASAINAPESTSPYYEARVVKPALDTNGNVLPGMSAIVGRRRPGR